MTEPGSSRLSGRVMRVFVSSTFRDMGAERDELVKYIFPSLRKLCEQRGVTWGQVDLRWGVTDEQKAEGRVLPICLDEIRHCRPYFIGLLGERYGWVPDELPDELVEREPWLEKQRGRSVTELEILHGVLNDPAMADHTYFYFRDPDYLKGLRGRERDAFREIADPDEIQKYGLQEAEQRADYRSRMLGALKERIRRSGLPLREGFPNPRTLGEWVLQDMTALVNRLYPEGGQPDPTARQEAEHEAFADRCASVYISRRAYFDRLDASLDEEKLPLVVLGESGSGKSALLANWGLRYRQAHPDEMVLMHFIGETSYGADWASMLRRILGELKRCCDLPGEIPDQPEVLRAAFANGLALASARRRVVLILDALDKLEDHDSAPDLIWLPPVLPPNAHLVVSTLPGRPLDELMKRGCPTLQVKPLEATERKELVLTYLAQYGKALSERQGGALERITNAPQSANPLYLRVLLEELNLFGRHEQLDERIDQYLEAATPQELYRKVLERCEQDYERERPGLVRDALSLLWAARRGLSEVELLELLGSKGKPIPGAQWSPLFLALEGSFILRAGLIDFAHDYLRQAAVNRYLPGEAAQLAAHQYLANYFEERELDRRKVDELPWQLMQAQAWQEMYLLLTELPFFKAAWKANEYELKACWAQIESHSDLRMVKGYKMVLDRPSKYPDEVWPLSILLGDTGHLLESLSLRKTLVETFRRSEDRENLQAALGNQAAILQTRGDLNEAMVLYREKESICRELGIRDGLSIALGNQAEILKTQGDLDGAMALHKEEERLCRELGDRDGLQACLGNQAGILFTRGDLEGAMALEKEVELACRELGNRAGLADCLVNQSNIFRKQCDPDRGMELLNQAELIYRELGMVTGLASCLGNRAEILKERGDLESAMALHKEEERLCRKLGDRNGLQRTFANQANILKGQGDLAGAMALHKEEERLCRELGNRNGLKRSLGNQAVILRTQGDLDGAMALHKEEERLCRELGDKDGLLHSFGNQATILSKRGDPGGALALNREEERLCRELGYQRELAVSLISQAFLWGFNLKQPGKALPLADEAHRMALECGDAKLAKQIETLTIGIREQQGK